MRTLGDGWPDLAPAGGTFGGHVVRGVCEAASMCDRLRVQPTANYWSGGGNSWREEKQSNSYNTSLLPSLPFSLSPTSLTNQQC